MNESEALSSKQENKENESESESTKSSKVKEIRKLPLKLYHCLLFLKTYLYYLFLAGNGKRFL